MDTSIYTWIIFLIAIKFLPLQEDSFHFQLAQIKELFFLAIFNTDLQAHLILDVSCVAKSTIYKR